MAASQVTVEITTTAQSQQAWQNSGNPPKITMNGNPFPQPAGGNPGFSSGIQVVVIDPTLDITSPSSIRSNAYQWLPNVEGSWMSYYEGMWDRVASQIYTSGNTSQQIVFVATFGMDVNAAPTSEALELLLELGSGPQLQKWWTSVDVGSQGGWWVGSPGNYILIGQPAYGYGEGTEAYQASGDPVTTSVTATLTNYGT
jgi:hypothetical protein